MNNSLFGTGRSHDLGSSKQGSGMLKQGWVKKKGFKLNEADDGK